MHFYSPLAMSNNEDDESPIGDPNCNLETLPVQHKAGDDEVLDVDDDELEVHITFADESTMVAPMGKLTKNEFFKVGCFLRFGWCA